MKILATSLMLVLVLAGPALAFDVNQVFKAGTNVLSFEGGAGDQANIENHKNQTRIDLWYIGLRYSLLPLEPQGPGMLRGSLELGMEPGYQKYYDKVEAWWMGLSVRTKWHFLSWGRFVPYVELGAGVGGTDLAVKEIDSAFAFLLSGGAGASIFVTDQIAVYGGYRMVHISNGNTSQPNRGFEAHTGLFGASYFFK
jgi:opacity protein-like surface antigen